MEYLHEGEPCELCGLNYEDTPNGECLVATMTVYQDMNVEAGPIIQQLATVKERIRVLASIQSAVTGEVGRVAKINGFAVDVVPPKNPRVTYDRKALDGYAVAHPEILQFRKEAMPKPSIKLKWLDELKVTPKAAPKPAPKSAVDNWEDKPF